MTPIFTPGRVYGTELVVWLRSMPNDDLERIELDVTPFMVLADVEADDVIVDDEDNPHLDCHRAVLIIYPGGMGWFRYVHSESLTERMPELWK